MWSLELVLLMSQGLLAAAGGRSSPRDDGFMPDCQPELFDMLISPTATDVIRLLLVDGGVNKFHSYNISRVGGLARDPLLKPELPTVMFMHGFEDKGRARTMYIPLYLERGGYNIISIEAHTILRGDYLKSVRLTRYVGKRLGIVLAQLFKGGFRTEKLELYGHSLGAHVLGFAAKTFKKHTGKTLPFITALDPAGACFRNVPAEDRLDSSDADFVQVIHTNAGVYGLRTPIGHVDFYVNGGKKQVVEGILPCGNVCSHVFSLQCWLETLKYPKGFIGVECASLDEVEAGWCRGADRKILTMGTYVDRNARGIYHVKTTGKKPYAMGINGVYLVNPLLKKT